MDTNKIREAAGKIWLNATSHGTEEPYATLSKIILAELDKAQQPCKVLTDEEIDSAARDHDASFAHQRSFREGARYARDNDYLDPAAGLTADQIVEVVLKWVYKSGEIDYNLITSLLPEEKEAGETKYVADLRARLTAALETKRKA